MSTVLDALPANAVAVVPSSNPVRSNPARRGPILLACDGNETSGAPVIAARMLAERLHLPLEVVTVLEPQAIYAVALGGTPTDAVLRLNSAPGNDVVGRGRAMAPSSGRPEKCTMLCFLHSHLDGIMVL